MARGDVERWPMWWAWLYSVFSANPRSNREMVRLAGPTTEDRIVDVGCGPGAAVRWAAAAGAQATGIDPSEAMVELARRRSRNLRGVRFEVGDAAELPLDDDSVTIAWAIATYHHWPDQQAGLAEIRRVLAPGGRLLIGERRLRRAGGHGLSADDADATAAVLRDLQYRDVTVQSRRLRLATMLVIVATA